MRIPVASAVVVVVVGVALAACFEHIVTDSCPHGSVMDAVSGYCVPGDMSVNGDGPINQDLSLVRDGDADGGGGACHMATDCMAAGAPICDSKSEVCRACTGSGDDAQCAAHGDTKIHCDSNTGFCVACNTDTDCTTATTPVCDNHVCRACNADSDCSSKVCEFSTGACVPSSMIALVDHGGTGVAACTTSRGATQTGNTSTTAWCDIQTAITSDTRKYLLVTGYGSSANAYNPISTIARNVTIVGPGVGSSVAAANRAVIVGSSTAAAVTLGAPYTLVLDGLEMTGASVAHDGVDCTNTVAVLTVRNSLVDSNNGAGIVSAANPTTITQSTISSNTGGSGIAISAGTYSISNNFIFENAVLSTKPGVDISLGTGHFFFNTVGHNGKGMNPGGVACGPAATIEASIIFGNTKTAGMTQFSGTCTFLSSVADPQETAVATGLVDATPAFTNVGSDDFTLDVMSAGSISTNKLSVLDIVTMPQAGGVTTLPTVDFFNVARPQNNGYDIGAQEAHY